MSLVYKEVFEDGYPVECEWAMEADSADLHKMRDQLRAHAAALEEVERLKKENDTLRGLLGNSAKPCPYCGLPAEDQAKCPSGFPGCARADDQTLSKHFADAYRAEQAERRAERLKVHAEAMAFVVAAAERKLGNESYTLAAYRRDFPKE